MTDEEGYVADFTVRPGIWDAETRIGEVGKKKHTVFFPGRSDSTTVTFCNNCGCAFTMYSKCAECGHG